jgi:hypothetical protein
MRSQVATTFSNKREDWQCYLDRYGINKIGATYWDTTSNQFKNQRDEVGAKRHWQIIGNQNGWLWGCFNGYYDESIKNNLQPEKFVLTTTEPSGFNSRPSPSKRIFHGECMNGKQILMFEGAIDNSGTDEERRDRCLEACIAKKAPLSGSWTGFGKLQGIIVKPGTGRCYCENVLPMAMIVMILMLVGMVKR